MRFVPFILLAAAVISGADAGYRAELERWRSRREASLKAEGGWLSVTGLFWLERGENRVGADPSAVVELPAGAAPRFAGILTLDGGRVSLRAADGAGVRVNGKPAAGARELKADTSGAPDTITVGRLTLLLLERGGRYAIRLKDPESSMRKEFKGLDWYPASENWRIEAKFVPYPKQRRLAFDTVVGIKSEMPSPGYVVFHVGGKECRLEPAGEDGGLFFVFRDATAGRTTYGAGRFLNTDPPRNGSVRLDFNKAVNPPCAFTPYATCPVPPKQNRLPIAIEAGEKKYEGLH